MIDNERRVENPCRGYCPDRDCECHAKCRKYAAYRAYIDECNRIRHATKEVYTISEPKKRWLDRQHRRKGRKISGQV